MGTYCGHFGDNYRSTEALNMEGYLQCNGHLRPIHELICKKCKEIEKEAREEDHG